MKSIKLYIFEALARPKTTEELQSLLEKLLKADKNANLNNIDVSAITDMSYVFEDLDPHDIDISKWNVSKVENMTGMFQDCENFNSDLSAWDVSNVKSMRNMFLSCKNFNCDLSAWDVRNVKDMDGAFMNCETCPDWYKGSTHCRWHK